MRERLSGGFIEGDAGVGVVGHGLDSSALIERQVALRLKTTAETEEVPKLKRFCSASSACCASTRVASGGFIAGAGLLQTDDGVLDVDADLAQRPLELQFALAQTELVGDVIGLRGAVAEGDVQREAGRIIRESCGGRIWLVEVAVAADEVRVGGAAGAVVERIERTR